MGGGCKSLEARLTRACLGDDGKGGGYALSLKSQVLTPCKSESVNSASPVMMSLKNKIFVSSDEVGNFDSDLVKTLTGGEPITARNMYSGLESFTPRFPVIEVRADLRSRPLLPRTVPHPLPVTPTAVALQQVGRRQQARALQGR